MPKINKSKITVAVAMSGGVDSSVAAAILKEQGFRVFGITMKTFCYEKIQGGPEGEQAPYGAGKKTCCGLEGIESAKKVCHKLGIPHYTIDISKEFTKKIINDFVKEYKAGRTPNPCVRCNQFVKFDILLKLAKKYGADFLATGHYARIRREIRYSNIEIRNKVKSKRSKVMVVYHLLRGKDKNKDQSYFLYTLNQKQLSQILFPNGDFKKQEIRKLAKKFKLSVADKEESQEVCFINTNLSEFLSSRIKVKQGEIIDSSGKILGKHRGIAFYTIGQRAGIGGKGPYYVAKINKKQNRIIVTNNKKDPLILRKEIVVSKLNWIASDPPTSPPISLAPTKSRGPDQLVPTEASGSVGKASKQGGLGGVNVQIRYNSKPAHGRIIFTPPISPPISAKRKQGGLGGVVKIKFQKPVFAPAPGQSAVFYSKDECVGGGIIES